MRSRTPLRHALLLLLALVLPCLVLVGTGVSMIRSGEELARARQADEDNRRLAAVGEELLARLERLKLEEAGALATVAPVGSIRPSSNPDVAMVGWIRDHRLVLPWDVDPSRTRFSETLAGSRFADTIAQGEREEAAGQLVRADETFGRARELAPGREWADYADLLRARALVQCGCPTDASVLFARVLDSSLVDDQGVPIALWAARQLVRLETRWSAVLDHLEQHPITPWHAPAAAYQARDVLTSLAADAPSAELRERAERMLQHLTGSLTAIERALALQRDWSGLEAARFSGGDDLVWISYGEGAWLVSAAPALAGLPPMVMAVRSQEVLKAAGAATETRPAVEFSLEAPGDLVGAAFPGLRVSMSEAPASEALDAWAEQRGFYVAALAAVIGVALLGGAFFWWDVRRELRAAEMRSQFVASVSHELRTPLTAIRMFAETLQLEQPLPAEGRAEYLETIVSESERLTRLVNNVLDLSRIERGEKVYRRESSSIARIVQRVVRAMQYPLTRQGFRLVVDVPDDLPPVDVDADAIEQALLNLLSNAVKYSGDSRVIAIAVSHAGPEMAIAVRDEGLGVDPAERERIFQRFYRVPSADNDRIPGTGLGLALVDHIVRNHGGRIDVTAAPGGKGSTFTIRLNCPGRPVRGEPSSETAPRSVPGAAPRPSEAS